MSLSFRAFVKQKESFEAVKTFLAAQGLAETNLAKGTIVDAAKAFATDPSPEFLLVELSSKETAKAFAELEQLANNVAPTTNVIVCGSVDELSFYKELIGMGVFEYMLNPIKIEQLEKAVKKQAVASENSAATSTIKARDDSRVIAIVGTRGGVGASTIAMNLAGIFAKRNYPTAVLDLDPEFGTIPLYADVEASRGFVDALEKPERVDSLFLDRAMTKVNDSLFVIGAERNLLEPAKISLDAAEKIVNQLKTKFAYIIVDVGNVMPHTHPVLQNSEVLIVTEQSIGGLRDSMRIADLVKIQLKNENIKIVVNNAGLNPKLETPLKDFEGGLGQKVDFSILFEQEHYGFGDSGRILAVTDGIKKSKLVDGLQKLVAAFMPESVGVASGSKKNSGFLGGLLKK